MTKPTKRHSIIKHASRFIVAGLLVAVLAGCGIIGTTYTVLVDPLIPRMPKPAEHSVKGKTVLIWVEDYSRQEKNALLRRELTRRLERELAKHKAGADIVEYYQLNQFRLQHPDHTGMSVEEIGRHFDTDEVVHLIIDKFQSQHEAGPGYYRVSFTGSIRVVDTETGERLWPKAEIHQPLAYVGTLSEGSGSEFEDRLVRQAAGDIAAQIAVAFYPLNPKKQP